MILVKRLKYGDDLKKEIEALCHDNNVTSAAVISSVGCVYKATVRLADGTTVKEYNDNYEILAVNGTISKDGSHLHISFSDINGDTFGGHLCYNTLVNTTCELVIAGIDKYSFSRDYDEKTGYDELVINKKEDF
ncbi:MAG TPA: DNA-binding protein [Erysipelotrichaceae bacterium]|jgi:predicted DNA-binding protein with PD1-like motif|nr:DNA-binding protein [Erysipelotrichaceae bacterium]